MIDTTFDRLHPRRRSAAARARCWTTTCVATAGLAFACTALWLLDRVVLRLGGSCASGGPYALATPCPEGTAAIAVLAMPAMFCCGALLAWSADRLHPGSAWIVFLAWPALFGALGWNFAEQALTDAQAPVWPLLLCAVVFALLALPVLLCVPAASRGSRAPRRRCWPRCSRAPP